MIKMIWCPMWRINKIESILTFIEGQGYILERVFFNTWFVFRVKKSNKCANYLITCKGFRRNDSMGNWDYALLSNHNASVINTSFCTYNYYRLTEDIEKTKFLKETRAICLRDRIAENLFYYSIVFVLGICLFFLSDDFWKQIVLFIVTYLGLMFIVTLVGLVIQIKQNCQLNNTLGVDKSDESGLE